MYLVQQGQKTTHCCTITSANLCILISFKIANEATIAGKLLTIIYWFLASLFFASVMSILAV